MPRLSHQVTPGHVLPLLFQHKTTAAPTLAMNPRLSLSLDPSSTLPPVRSCADQSKAQALLLGARRRLAKHEQV